jgi:hypothetical protein
VIRINDENLCPNPFLGLKVANYFILPLFISPFGAISKLLNRSVCLSAKAKLSMCLIKHYAMKTYGGVDV